MVLLSTSCPTIVPADNGCVCHKDAVFGDMIKGTLCADDLQWNKSSCFYFEHFSCTVSGTHTYLLNCNFQWHTEFFGKLKQKYLLYLTFYAAYHH